MRMEGPQGSDGHKRAREDKKIFVSPHHEKIELSWDQERKLRLSCELRHLRYRHTDDLVLVLKKAALKEPSVVRFVADKLRLFNARDNVEVDLAAALTDPEQRLYARRLSLVDSDLHWRYPGDLAQVIESVVQEELIDEQFVIGELKRINIAQSDARKKLRGAAPK